MQKVDTSALRMMAFVVDGEYPEASAIVRQAADLIEEMQKEIIRLQHANRDNEYIMQDLYTDIERMQEALERIEEFENFESLTPAINAIQGIASYALRGKSRIIKQQRDEIEQLKALLKSGLGTENR